MTNPITDERLRNTRAWAAARVGSLSGADVIVGAIDELFQARGNLSLAEEGLASAMQEIERQKAFLVDAWNETQTASTEIARLQAESDAWDKLSLVQLHRKLAEKQETIDGWVHANGPGGWIDELRQRARGHHEPSACRTDSRLAGDIEYCLAKINPATDIYAVLTQVMTDLRTPVKSGEGQ